MLNFPQQLKNILLVLVCAGLLTVALTAQAGNTITRYVMTDPQGNPVAITDSTGEVIWRQSYAPYGQQYQQADPDGPGFTGHRNDAATGLVYMQARYYDPKIGRFLSVDPVTFSPDQPQFFNRYWYAVGNPYKYTVPDGRCPMFHCDEVANFEFKHPDEAKVVVPLGVAAGALSLGITVLAPIAVDAVAGGAGAETTAGTITRYMGSEEAAKAIKDGEIPNTDKSGRPRPTHVTQDPPLSSSSEAAKKYALPEPPTHSATVPASRVPDLGPAPDGKPQTTGGGNQSATNKPIPVKPTEIKPLGP